MGLHGDHVRGHGRAVVHVRADSGGRAVAGRGVRAHVPPDGILPGKHRTRPAEYPAAGQQHPGQRPAAAVDRPRFVPADQQQRPGNRRGRATASAVN